MMPSPSTNLSKFSALLSLICGTTFLPVYSQLPSTKRPVTVADSIRMTRLAERDSRSTSLAQYSPDGKRFTIVTSRGNLEQNTNEYSLLLFNISDVFSSPIPRVLLTVSTSSNEAGISRLRWLDDDTIAFIGQPQGESQQLYTFTVSDKKIERLISHPRNLKSYDITPQRDNLAFLAEPPPKSLTPDDAKRRGIIITSQALQDLMAGDNREGQFGAGLQLFVKKGKEVARKITTKDRISLFPGVSISPDGGYALVQAGVTHPPDRWREYTNTYIQQVFRQKSEGSGSSLFRYYLLIDIKTGATEPLLDSPLGPYPGGFAWRPDGQSVVVSSTLLPLNVPDSAERKDRQENVYVAEVKLANREIIEVTRKPFVVLKQDFKTGELLLRNVTNPSQARSVFVKNGRAWQESGTTGKDESSINRIDLIVEEDINTPPKVAAVNSETKQKALLLDLNPQFKELAFGKVEHVTWTTIDGQKREGGLYLPPDYVPGKKYPLVIQTHGFNPKSFWIDGPSTTAFAAQSLAGKGIIVIQIDDAKDRMNVMYTPEGAPRDMAAYEGAIDYLNRRGIIDPGRVGLIGWSYTCHRVKYTLTHSKYHFSAATGSDGIDAGYFQYISFSNIPSSVLSYDQINGGSPFGNGIQAWLQNSPGFNLHRVKTPMRIEAINPTSVLQEWEWFAGLRRLEKPVEFVYIPDAAHIMVRPWDRMISQQGNVDWFTFWLKGEEDPDPSKAEQYNRWRELKKLQAPSASSQ